MNLRLNGRIVHRGYEKIFVILILLIILPPTLPFHCAKWFIDGRGFSDGRRNYEPGGFWTWFSVLVVYGAILALVLA